ncbi:hypothetical protein [Ideonella paludis]
MSSPTLAAARPAATLPEKPKALTAYRPYWAKRFGTAPFCP